MKKNMILDFNTAFKYPFNRGKGLLNILWVLLPIFGWFALMGYGIRIIKEFSKGKFKELPFFNFKSDLNFGFIMFIKAIPFGLAYLIITAIFDSMDPSIGTLVIIFLELFVAPVLTINFFIKETVSSYFEFRTLRYVFNNFVDYIMVLLRSILLFVVFLVMSIILIGIPANAFSQYMFLTDFYRRNVK